MRIYPGENGFGAFVVVDDARGLCSAQSAQDLRLALEHFQVLVIPQATTDVALFGRIARALGELVPHDFVSGLENDEWVHEIRKAPEHVHNFGGTWHSDGAYLTSPPQMILLQAVDVPETGGDTLWACQFTAYEALSKALKAEFSRRTVLHAAAVVFGGYVGGAPEEIAQSCEHPLFRWIPGRCQAALFHSGPCAQRIVGIPEDASRDLLCEMMDIASRARTFRHAWRPGDLVLWDNRSTLHKALNDYQGQSRCMRRAMIGHDTPSFLPVL